MIVLHRDFSIYRKLPQLPPIQPVITAGGHSTRMGMSKILAPLHSSPLITYIYEQLACYFGTSPLLIINDDTIRSAIPYPSISDIHPHCGPISGLETALSCSPTPYIYFTACDTPYVDPDFLIALLTPLTENPHWDVIMPTVSKRLEPLHALYHKNILPTVSTMREEKIYAIRHILPQVPHRVVPADAYSDTFFNINTMEDLAWAENHWFPKHKNKC